jgi:hypothetical protein
MLLKETMRQVTSPIPSNVLVQNGYQPHHGTGRLHSAGGMNVIHLETEQAVEHTKLMISHLRKEDELGRMIQMSIDHLLIHAGTS